MKKYFPILFVFYSLCVSSQDPWKDVYTESAWAERDKWQKADELIRYLNLKPGSLVADIGCGEGYMTFKLAKVVGNSGKVYAVDNRMSVVWLLETKLKNSEVTNVKIVGGSANEVKLPTDSLDAIIILDTYHEIAEYTAVLDHLKLSLKKNGRLVLCEPISDERRKLNRNDQQAKHELGMNFALADLQKAGYTIIKNQDPFVDRGEGRQDVANRSNKKVDSIYFRHCMMAFGKRFAQSASKCFAFGSTM